MTATPPISGFKFHSEIIYPKTMAKQHQADAGLDITSAENVVVPARGSVLVRTGLFLEIPESFVGLLWSRSGLSVKHKIQVGAGCIDSGYAGEVKVHLFNHSDTDYYVAEGDAIAQLLTIPVVISSYQHVPFDELNKSTQRGSNGYGSTGR